jgi:hypothetical protein
MWLRNVMKKEDLNNGYYMTIEKRFLDPHIKVFKKGWCWLFDECVHDCLVCIPTKVGETLEEAYARIKMEATASSPPKFTDGIVIRWDHAKPGAKTQVIDSYASEIARLDIEIARKKG